MATKKEIKKLQKKRQKEKENRKEALKKREEMRKPAREEREQHRRERRISKLRSNMADYQFFDTESFKDLDDSKLEQLEKNVEVLRGLEKEWQEENNKKMALNKDLEAQGHATLDEKLRAVSEATIQQQKEEMGVGGSADYRSSGGGEYAEVTVQNINDIKENS